MLRLGGERHIPQMDYLLGLMVNRGKKKGRSRERHGLLPVCCGYEPPGPSTTSVEANEESHVGRDRQGGQGRGGGQGGGQGRGRRDEGRDRERGGGGSGDRQGATGEWVTEHEFRERMRERLDQMNDRLDRIVERLDRLER